ncbi:hypothetical protein KAR91_46915 [Candidatus Pacearchaeota archaeon]|nr:hypothetical protein [Candidatus Pacearchaeota archaeon]
MTEFGREGDCSSGSSGSSGGSSGGSSEGSSDDDSGSQRKIGYGRQCNDGSHDNRTSRGNDASPARRSGWEKAAETRSNRNK